MVLLRNGAMVQLVWFLSHDYKARPSVVMSLAASPNTRHEGVGSRHIVWVTLKTTGTFLANLTHSLHHEKSSVCVCACVRVHT